MVKDLEQIKDFMNRTSEDSAAICRAAEEMLGEDDCFSCLIVKGKMYYSIYAKDDKKRMEVNYRYNGVAVSKVEEETVIKEEVV